jgi:hypothetical protein
MDCVIWAFGSHLGSQILFSALCVSLESQKSLGDLNTPVVSRLQMEELCECIEAEVLGEQMLSSKIERNVQGEREASI